MIVIQPVSELTLVSKAGSILELAVLLEEHYLTQGYSLTREDIAEALRLVYLFYSAWATTQEQVEAVTPSTIGDNTIVSVPEWGIIEPVLRAYLDCMQAQRMEGTASLGVERFGLSVSEAKQAYSVSQEEMKKNAFVEKPFTIDYAYTKPLKNRYF